MRPEHFCEDDFALAGGNGRRHRNIPTQWVNYGERVFGGYSAALCFAAAVSESTHPAICSGHVAFLETVHPGRIDFEVSVLRRGRSLTALRVDAFQNERRSLVCHTWLRSAPTVEAAPPGSAPDWPDPAHAVDLSWLVDVFTFHRLLEARGVDYPASRELFQADGRRTVDVWLRPKDRQLAAGTLTQLFDVIVADAHIGDCHLRGAHQGCGPENLVSIDLAMQWTPVLHRPGWRRIQAESPTPAQGCAASVATIFDETGAICATAAQQTWEIPASLPR